VSLCQHQQVVEVHNPISIRVSCTKPAGGLNVLKNGNQWLLTFAGLLTLVSPDLMRQSGVFIAFRKQKTAPKDRRGFW